MSCNPSLSNQWAASTTSSRNAKAKNLKNQSPSQATTSVPLYSNDSQFPYLNRRGDYPSIASTPLGSQPTIDTYAARSTKNTVNKFYNKQNASYSSSDNLIIKKPKQKAVEHPIRVKKNQAYAEKRNVIIFKVIEQIVDPTTKRILKEKVIKNDEIVTSCGQVAYDAQLSNNITTSSSNITASSSGHLGDISSSESSATHPNSVRNELVPHSPISIDVNLKNDFVNQDDSTNSGNQNTVKAPETPEKELVSSSDNMDLEEEQRRLTATALLTLSNNNSPVKASQKLENSKLTQEETMMEQDAISSKLVEIDETQNETEVVKGQDHQDDHIPNKLRPGIKVMAKWKDKKFYPADVIKQIGTNKWSVKYEDSAAKNLFESEIISLEHLVPNQEVMVTVSDSSCDNTKLCVSAKIKKVFRKNDKKIEFDLEFTKDGNIVVERYQLKEIFLNVEQSNSVLNKMAKPSSTPAVFADVDLDNIVVGKRSRCTKSAAAPTVPEEPKVIAKKKPLSQDSQSSSKNSTTKKRKKNTISTENIIKDITEDIKVDTTPKAAPSNFTIAKVDHYHESSLSVSPRLSKDCFTMASNELEKVLGPVPRNNSKIFDRISFLLTSGDRTKSLSGEHLSNPVRSVPFDKAYLTKQISAGGGKLFDSFEDMKVCFVCILTICKLVFS